MAKHGSAFGGRYFYVGERNIGFTKGDTVGRYLNYGADDDVQIRRSNPIFSKPKCRFDREVIEMLHNATKRTMNKAK